MNLIDVYPMLKRNVTVAGITGNSKRVRKKFLYLWLSKGKSTMVCNM